MTAGQRVIEERDTEWLKTSAEFKTGFSNGTVSVYAAPSGFVQKKFRQRIQPDAKSVSYSEMRTFTDCRAKWHYTYQRQIERDATPDYAPTFGKCGHAAVMAYYRGQDVRETCQRWLLNEVEKGRMSEENEADYDHIVATVPEIIRRYHDRYARDGWKVLAIEQEFEIALPGKLRFIGIWDLIVMDQNGHIWIVDHKFPQRGFRKDYELELDLQIGSYEWAAQKLGWPVSGTIYNQFIPKLPKVPEMNKSKPGLSKARITTDYETYHAAILQNGLNPSDYAEQLAYYSDKQFFYRNYVVRSPEEVQNFAAEMMVRAKEMKRKNLPIFKSPSVINCSKCPFKDLCCETSRSRDPEQMIEAMYRPRSRKDADILIEGDDATTDEELISFMQ